MTSQINKENKANQLLVNFPFEIDLIREIAESLGIRFKDILCFTPKNDKDEIIITFKRRFNRSWI